MKQIPCEVIRDLLPSYVDGLVSDTTKQLIEQHLDECEECRKIYESMKEDTVIEDDAREIDFLKKTRSHTRKTVIAAAAAVLALVLLITGIRTFVTGSKADAAAFAVNVQENDNTFMIEGDIIDSARTVSSVKFTEEGDTLIVDVKTALASFIHSSGHFRETYSTDKEIRRIVLNGSVIYEDGENISKAVSDVMNTHHAYIGDMSMNARTAAAAGISDSFGSFTNILQTEKQPYGWTLVLEEDLYDRVYQEKQMEKKACILIAMVDNLSEVTFEYFADGKTCTKTITEAEADELAGFHVKDAAESCSLLAKLTK